MRFGLQRSVSSYFGRWIRTRQLAEDFVEFGIIVASVSLVGMAGLQALGHAQLSYFQGLPLAQPTPVGSNVSVNGAAVDIDCTRYTIAVTHSTDCTLRARDSGGSTPNSPDGQIRLIINGTDRGGCTLAADLATPDPYDSVCSAQWVPNGAPWPGDVGVQRVYARYVSTDGHVPPSPEKYRDITVQHLLSIQTACDAPWSDGVVGAPPATRVEPGHPLNCTILVRDQISGLPFHQDLTVTWTPEGGAGHTQVYCFTGMTECPPPGDPERLRVDGPATCQIKADVGLCQRSFRRSHAANLAIDDGFEEITLKALPTDEAGVNEYKIPVWVTKAEHPHGVEIVTSSCSGVISSSPLNVRLDPTAPASNTRTTTTVNAVTVEDSPPTPITCTVVVYDTDPNPAIDQYGCQIDGVTSGANPADDCAAINSIAHPPLGRVYWGDPAVLAVNQNATLASCDLGTSGLRPPFEPALAGQPEFAAWCTSTPFVVPPGTPNIVADYRGDNLVNPAHVTDQTDYVAVTFN